MACRLLCAVAASSLFGFGSSVVAQEVDDPPRSFSIEAPQNAALGWGWSQVSVTALPTICVQFEPVSRDAAQDAQVEVTEVHDSHSLSKAMDVSTSVSGSYAGVKGSGKMSFASNSSVSSSSVSYLVQATVLNSSTIAAPIPNGDEVSGVVLTRDALRLARRSLDTFRDVCGEGFISAARGGARAYMLATTETTSSSQRSSVRAEVEVSGWGAKASAAAGSSSSSETSNLTRKLSFYQQGGTAAFDEPITYTDRDGKDVTIRSADLPSNAEEGIARIRKLAYAAAQAEQVFEMEVTPYELLSNFPRDIELWADEDEHTELSALWGSYDTIRDSIILALRNPEAWRVPVRQISGAVAFEAPLPGTPANALLKAHHDAIRATEIALERVSLACFAEGDACEVDYAAFPSPYGFRASLPLPVFREADAPDTTSTGSLTTFSSEEDDDAAPTDLMEEHTRVHLEEPNMGRCTLSANEPGCIAFTELSAWGSYRGLVPILTTDVVALADGARSCLSDAGLTQNSVAVPLEALVLQGEVREPDAPVVWVPPILGVNAAGDLVCPDAGDRPGTPASEPEDATASDL